jgi:beta-glucanase (GH16 family)
MLPFLPFLLSSWLTLTFQDSFDTINPAIWSDWCPGLRYEAYSSQDAVTCKDGVAAIAPYTKNGIHYSAALSTEHSFRASCGLWRARVRLSSEGGAWSDFWLYNREVASEEKGTEIDIFEHRKTDGHKDIPDLLVHALHWDGYSYKHKCKGQNARFDSQDWVVTCLVWTPTEFVWFVDGRETWRTSEGHTKIPNFIIFSVEIQDNFWAGRIDPKGFSGRAQLEIDWVQYWDVALWSKKDN